MDGVNRIFCPWDQDFVPGRRFQAWALFGDDVMEACFGEEVKMKYLYLSNVQINYEKGMLTKMKMRLSGKMFR